MPLVAFTGKMDNSGRSGGFAMEMVHKGARVSPDSCVVQVAPPSLVCRILPLFDVSALTTAQASSELTALMPIGEVGELGFSQNFPPPGEPRIWFSRAPHPAEPFAAETSLASPKPKEYI